MLQDKKVFEIQVYKTSEEEYYEKMTNYIAEKNRDDNPQFEEYLRNKFGGDWDYNEIVGHVKIYITGRKIKCEYWETDKKVRVGSRTKTFVKISDKYCESQIFKGQSNDELKSVITECIEQVKKIITTRIKTAYVDTEIFDTQVEHIDWIYILNGK